MQRSIPWPCLAVMVGNSRLHWAVLGWEASGLAADRPVAENRSASAPSSAPWVSPRTLSSCPAIPTHDSPHLGESKAIAPWLSYLQDLQFPPAIRSWLQTQFQPPPLLLASVHPPQAAHFDTYPHLYSLHLDAIPLGQRYPGLGIDRALALWGAGQKYGWPVLVIDGGTALTLTGGDRSQNLVGGAILPGLGLQWRSLHQGTAQLPPVQWSIEQGYPDRWARSPQGAIASGVLHSVLAGLRSFIDDWERQQGTSAIVLTGGDGPLLWQLLNPEYHCDPNLIFTGMAHLPVFAADAP